MTDLIDALKAVVGVANCLTQDTPREKYDNDITGVYKGRSLAVGRPANTDEVQLSCRLNA